MSENSLRLIVGGKNYTGWKSAGISRSIEEVSGKFSLSLTDMVRGEGLPLIKRNDPAKIEIQSTPESRVIKLLNGFVDKVSVKVDKKSIGFTITGRDKTGDIVDSSIIEKSEFKGLKFEQAVQLIVDPFNIKVVVQEGLDTGDTVDTFVYDQGTKIYELLAKNAQLKQLLLYTLPDGRLIVARAATEVSSFAFVEGGPDGNILTYEHTSDGTKVFSEYHVKGSHPVAANETEAQAAQVKGKADDKRIGRFRPLLIVPDTKQNKTSAADRALWELQKRRADAEGFNVTIQGWLPALNVIAPLKLETSNFEGNMLISAHRLRFDGSGKKTILRFVHPDSFKALPTNTVTKDDKDSPLNQ